MITGTVINKHISCECKCSSDRKNVVQINGGITINVDVSVKNIIYLKEIMFGVLQHVFLKIFS